MDSYDRLLPYLQVGVVLNFQEFTLNRREKKKLSLDTQRVVIHEVIPPNHPLDKALMMKYYGDSLADKDYLQLSMVNCLRIVVINGVDEESQPIYQVLSINRDFYNMGLQTVDILSPVTLPEPVYEPDPVFPPAQPIKRVPIIVY